VKSKRARVKVAESKFSGRRRGYFPRRTDMPEDTPSNNPSGSWMEEKLRTLNALYHRYGRDGLKDQNIADIKLLLASKEFQFRDSAKDSGLGDEQKAANRQFELEIKDLTAYVRGQIAALSLDDLRSFKRFDKPQQDQQYKPRSRDRGMER
jgi:hypothetical protein